jgi:hypothetical protein
VLLLEECPLSPEWTGIGIKAGTGRIGSLTANETGATEIGIETGIVAAAGVTVTATTKPAAKETASAT